MSIKKIIFGLTAIVLLFGLSGSAQALTADEIVSALLNNPVLLSQVINSLGGATPGTGVPSGACNFMQSLTIGSSGAEVTCLQNYLIAGDYSIPAGATGYFGPQTQSAVMAWQRANAVSPASGLFGPISRAAYNSMAFVTPPPPSGGALCPNGNPVSNNCAPVTPPPTEPLCPNGNTIASNCATAPGGVVEPLCPNGNTIASNCVTAPGTTPPPVADAGLVTTSVSLESSPANGTDITRNRPASAVDIARWKIKATNSAGILRQFGIRASHRPWLYWSKAALVVGGNVIAEKANLTSSDFSEVTSGSDYRLVFSGLNQTLAKDADTFVILRVYSSADSGRAAVNGLTVDQVSNSISVADADDPTYTVTDGDGSDRTYDFIAASTGNIVPSNSTTALGERWVKVSTSGTTPNVTLAVFDLKAEQRPATITSLKIGANTAGTNNSTLITSYDLYEGSCPTDGDTTGCTLIAGGSQGTANGNAAASASSSLTFSSLTVNIPAETKKTFTLKGLFADESDFTVSGNDAASTTLFLTPTDIAGHDDNFDTLTVSGANITSGGVHAALFPPTLSGTSGSFTLLGDERLATISFTFSLKADGGTLYISKTNDTLVATTSDLAASGTTGLMGNSNNPVDVTPCSNCGDTATVFGIPAGITRTFRLEGQMSNTGTTPTSGPKNFKITKIFFGDDSTNLTEFSFDTNFAQLGTLNINPSLLIANVN